MFNRAPTKDVSDQIVDDDGSHDERLEEPTDSKTTSETTADDRPVSEAAAPAEGEAGAQAVKDPETKSDSSARDRWRRRAPIVAILMALAASAGAAAFFGWQLKRQNDQAESGRAAIAVANEYAVVLTSIDSAKVDENYAKVLDGATGEFRDMYSQSAAQLRQLLIDNKAVSHGTVVDSAIKSATTNKVEVLLFVDQSIINAVNPEPRIDRSRVTMTLENIDGRWLASKVDIK